LQKKLKKMQQEFKNWFNDENSTGEKK